MTTARSARTRLAPEVRRSQLLECALAAFAEHGVARATHSHVAERAGVSVPAVHSYFRTREDLVTAVLGEVETYLIEIVSRSLGGPKSVSEALTELAVNFARDAKDKPDMIKVWLDWSTGVRADVWPRYMDVLERLHGIARKVLERGKREGVIPQGLNVKAAARVYLGGGHTVALMQFSDATSSEFEAVIDHLVRAAMGMGVEAAPV
ncbi:MAG: TetR/AcrR family transcriptional regulator [Parvibaculum sp.]|uniref:TetR/AcrR family transcriptional regulator n=1 Tax=Parvibaculum sp. TaxID=2024848 RepID=UPI0027176984|nr:TetR/AcrR family transcriptional regulator [Parvibaculum sp.]MDO8839408.1 TetR/AcrR family transcriptional regulator [Parvibaculum sp.]